MPVIVEFGWWGTQGFMMLLFLLSLLKNSYNTKFKIRNA